MARSKDIYRPGLSYVMVRSDQDQEPEEEPTISDLIGWVLRIRDDLLMYAAMFFGAQLFILWLIAVKVG
jgi:hypothetical protein